MATADAPVDFEFPIWALLPKKETGVLSFLAKYPEYDGRGVTIAIFDSGVDPAAAGLQKTSTGETKVIERFDCSGSGDVDTSTIVQLKDGRINGLTGRPLEVPTDWINPSGEWRIGVVHPFSLYPTKLKERVQEHRKEHLWDPQHKQCVATASRKLQEFELKHGQNTLKAEEKLLKDELEARIEVLTNLEKKYNDIGPTYDCVVFNDGTVWRACIDTSECGNLSSGILLSEYSVTYEYDQLTPLDQLTISINIHNNGNILEICGMCSSHGTHVACIAAANFADNPEKNGVAPGAKIISLMIGDTRLGSMETGTALVRACIKVMELSKETPVHVINMSYGEHAHWSNSGRVGDVINEIVNKYRVSWVVSAGNHGPALCTVGSPPDISQPNLIGVAAYVSPEMMTAAYSLRQKLAGSAYSWSSRAPCADGAAGVSVAAPGGAITSVARFTLRCQQLMNGTSMSAPHVAGAVAVLLSGLIAEEKPFSPYSVKRALENSATYLQNVEPFAQGCGLLNIEKAFEMLRSHCNSPERDVRFSITCGQQNQKGIHIRSTYLDKPKEVAITVEPYFIETPDVSESVAAITDKIDFSMKLALTCDADWIHCPSFLDMTNISKPFAVKIDPSGLQPGPHFAWILAYDVACIDKGPVFRVPVTVIQPQLLDLESPASPSFSESMLFKPGTIKRNFVVVPEKSTWAILRLNTVNKEKQGRFLIHCMQKQPRLSCRTSEFQKMVVVTPQSETAVSFQVKSGLILEVVVAKYWANLGDIDITYTVEFHGVPLIGIGGNSTSNTLILHGADGLQALHLASLRSEEIQPSAQLKNSVQIIRPTESKINPLTLRDVIPPGRQIYELINTYNFHIAKATEITPNISLLSDTLYESEFESQLWMLFDNNKQHLASGDAYPSKYSVKVERGEFVLKLQVRQDKREALEKLSDIPLLLQQRLPQSLTLDFYSSHAQALTLGKKMSSALVYQGGIVPFYAAPLPADKIGKNLSVGHFMSGTITFAKDELGKKADVYQLKYILPEAPKKNNDNGKNKDKEKTKAEEYADALRDLKTSWISKLETDQAKKVYEELVAEFPSHLGSHVAFLTHLEPAEARRLPTTLVPSTEAISSDISQRANLLLTTADKVIESVDQEKLLAYFGMKTDTRPDASKIKILNEKQRAYFLEALSRKGIALCMLHRCTEFSSAGDSKEKHLESILNVMNDILKFTDATDSKVIYFSFWLSVTLNHWGKAVKVLQKMSDEKSCKEVDEKLIEVFDKLEWTHASSMTSKAIPAKYPTAYRLF